jgi:tetratricopeptide (TPR) repeat protein
MLSRVKPRAAAERIRTDCSHDLLADLHLVVDDALEHGEIDKANAYSHALMRVAHGEPPGFLPPRFSGDKTISYRQAQRSKRLNHIYAPLLIGAVLTTSFNHFSIAMELSGKLCSGGLLQPAMQVTTAEVALEEALNAPRAATLGMLAYELNCSGRFEDALVVTNSALSRFPIEGLVVRNKLAALSCIGNYEEVLATVKETQSNLFAYDRDSSQIYAAEAYTHLNDLAGAMEAWNSLPEDRKTDSQLARIVSGRILFMEGELNDAERIFHQALSRRGIRHLFVSHDFRRAQVAYLQANILQIMGKESRANKLRSKTDKMVVRDKLKLPFDPLLSDPYRAGL